MAGGAAVLHAIAWLNIVIFHLAHPDSKGERLKKQEKKKRFFLPVFALHEAT